MSVTNEIGSGAAASAAAMLVKTSPPMAVTGLSLAGVPLSDAVYIATLVWISIQAGFFLYDRIKKRRASRKGRTRIFRDE